MKFIEWILPFFFFMLILMGTHYVTFTSNFLNYCQYKGHDVSGNSLDAMFMGNPKCGDYVYETKFDQKHIVGYTYTQMNNQEFVEYMEWKRDS